MGPTEVYVWPLQEEIDTFQPRGTPLDGVSFFFTYKLVGYLGINLFVSYRHNIRDPSDNDILLHPDAIHFTRI